MNFNKIEKNDCNDHGGQFKVFHYSDLFVIAVVFFCFGALRSISAPGIYMDGVNPDYLAVQRLYPALHNTNWAIPSVIGPILGGLYHGVQNYYAALVSFFVFGPSLFAVRFEHAIFGVAILWFLYIFWLKVSEDRRISIFATLALAVNLSFIASFRTQFYITVSGDLWLILSLYFIYGAKANDRKAFVFGGIAAGLAAYSYFVYLFFFPCLFFYVAFLRDRNAIFLWCAGVFLGLLPYLVGYASLFAAVGGVSEGIQWVEHALKALAPLSEHGHFWPDLKYAINCTSLASSNGGNELMIFKHILPGRVGEVIGFGELLLVLAAIQSTWKKRELSLAMMPAVYIIIASFLGKRLWVHHYIVLIPLAFSIAALGYSREGRGRRLFGRGLAVPIGALILLSFVQSTSFFKALNRSGGVGNMSSATTAFALQAQTTKSTIFCFPEWGFFMPFDILTENKVPYSLDASTKNLRSLSRKYSNVEVAFWNEKSETKYRDNLISSGVKNIRSQAYYNRDGEISFFVLVGKYR